MTSKGQITIPKEIRDRLGVRPGDRVRFRETAEGTIVVEAEATDLMDLFGALSPPRGRHVSVEEMEAAVRKSGGRTRAGK